MSKNHVVEPPLLFCQYNHLFLLLEPFKWALRVELKIFGMICFKSHPCHWTYV